MRGTNFYDTSVKFELFMCSSDAPTGSILRFFRVNPTVCLSSRNVLSCTVASQKKVFLTNRIFIVPSQVRTVTHLNKKHLYGI